MRPKNRPPTHPGEVFEEEYRKRSGLSQAEAARQMHMSANRLNEIVAGKRRVTVDTAIWFAALTETSAEMWARMQADYDVYHAYIRLGHRRAERLRGKLTAPRS